MFVPCILERGISLQMTAKLCALNLFFGRDNELPIYHGNVVLMDNKHRKLFVTKQSKWRKKIFMPEMHQNTFGGRAPPGPAGGAFVLPNLYSRNRGLLLSGREGHTYKDREGRGIRGGEGPTYKRREGRGKGLLLRGTQGRMGIPPK